eukprot:scaffold15068_cov41-Attheya_sp.AAC.1
MFRSTVSRHRGGLSAVVVKTTEIDRWCAIPNKGRCYKDCEYFKLVPSRYVSSWTGHHDLQQLSKVVGSAEEALGADLKSGQMVAIGGFGLGGIPETLLQEVARRKDVQNLTVASLTASVDGFGIGLLLESQGKVKRIMSSYVGENKTLERRFFGGDLEVELVPQGTLAARWRAAGSGMPAFFTPTGAGTIYAHGGVPMRYSRETPMQVDLASLPKTVQIFGGQEYVMEESLPADVSLVKAYKADTRGNLVFRGTSRNANPDVAMAGKVCIAEAEHIVEAGQLQPDEIHLPGVYVDKVILSKCNEKRIERLRVKETETAVQQFTGGRARIMRRAAKEFKTG